MPAATHNTLVWLEPDQAEFVRAVGEAAGLKFTHAGSPSSGKSRDVAAALGAEPVDDLRAALAATKADLVLLAASPSDNDMSVAEAEPLLACADRGVAIATFEPLPASILHVQRPDYAGDEDRGMGVAIGPEPVDAPSGGAAAQEWAAFVPLGRLSKPVRDAAEIISQLGTLTMVSVQAFSGPGQGSLGARVYDAMELVVWLLGQPERVDAAYVSPIRTRGVHPLPADSLRGLDGDLSANLRFGDGRAAAIVASNRAGRWGRSVTLVGENGRLRIYDDGLDWVGPDGRLIDASRDKARIRGAAQQEAAAAPGVRAAADQIVRLLDESLPVDQPTNLVAVLAATGAALLSARTGEGESPGTILRMARTG